MKTAMVGSFWKKLGRRDESALGYSAGQNKCKHSPESLLPGAGAAAQFIIPSRLGNCVDNDAANLQS